MDDSIEDTCYEGRNTEQPAIDKVRTGALSVLLCSTDIYRRGCHLTAEALCYA